MKPGSSGNVKEQKKTEQNWQLNAFVCRNIHVWNRLPAHIVNSDSVAVLSVDWRV